MKEIKKIDDKAVFRFIGGDYMQAVGGDLFIHYREMAYMGFLEVLKNILSIRSNLKSTQKDIQAFNPDALILIDYAGFNLRIARFAKTKRFTVFYYISPKLWAWNQNRARKVKKYVDHMFAIMPFEVDFYKKFGYDKVSYVGNPVVDAIKNYTVDPDFKTQIGLAGNSKKVIAVLPGSRKQELEYILPEISTTIKQNQDLLFLVAQVDNLDKDLYQSLERLNNAKLITGKTYEILANSDAAIVTSGTATLETALWNVSQVVVYKSSAVSMFIARLVVKVNYISLVNLIQDSEIISELIQENCTPALINTELQRILQQPTDYSRLMELIGNNDASATTANGIIDLLQAKD